MTTRTRAIGCGVALAALLGCGIQAGAAEAAAPRVRETTQTNVVGLWRTVGTGIAAPVATINPSLGALVYDTTDNMARQIEALLRAD